MTTVYLLVVIVGGFVGIGVAGWLTIRAERRTPLIAPFTLACWAAALDLGGPDAMHQAIEAAR